MCDRGLLISNPNHVPQLPAGMSADQCSGRYETVGIYKPGASRARLGTSPLGMGMGGQTWDLSLGDGDGDGGPGLGPLPWDSLSQEGEGILQRGARRVPVNRLRTYWGRGIRLERPRHWVSHADLCQRASTTDLGYVRATKGLRVGASTANLSPA